MSQSPLRVWLQGLPFEEIKGLPCTGLLHLGISVFLQPKRGGSTGKPFALVAGRLGGGFYLAFTRTKGSNPQTTNPNPEGQPQKVPSLKRHGPVRRPLAPRSVAAQLMSKPTPPGLTTASGRPGSTQRATHVDGQVTQLSLADNISCIIQLTR